MIKIPIIEFTLNINEHANVQLFARWNTSVYRAASTNGRLGTELTILSSLKVSFITSINLNLLLQSLLPISIRLEADVWQLRHYSVGLHQSFTSTYVQGLTIR